MQAVLKFIVFRAVVPLSLLAILFSYFGRLHPIGDSLAVFRQLFICLILIEVIWRLHGFLRWLAIIPLAAVIIGFLVQPFAVPQADEAMPAKPGGLRIYQKNLRFDNRQTEDLAQDILESDADFVTLQEVFRHNEAILDLLAEVYPTSLVCEFAGVGSVGILSKFPKADEDGVCADWQGLAALRLMTPDGPLWVGSMHFHWPWPFQQADQVDRLLPFIEKMEGPVVLAGDANMVPTSNALFLLERASRTKVVSNLGPTFFIAGVWALRIDQVFTPDGSGTMHRRPFLGSDHLGLIADFSLPAS